MSKLIIISADNVPSVVFPTEDAHAMESSYHVSYVGNNNGINERTKQSQKLLHYCPKCLRSFTLKSNRNRHLRYECGYEPRFKCPYCELRSKQTSHIYCHIRKKHPAEKVYVVDLKSKSGGGLSVRELYRRGGGRRGRRGGQNHVCPKCGNGYMVIKSLRRHMRYECGQRPRFTCPYCGARSKQRNHIRRHIMRKHYDTKTIELETNLSSMLGMCTVLMKESESFDHEEEKPLSTKRRRSGTDIERHTCSRCFKSYVHAWHLNRHTKFECGQEPRVQCPYCSAKMKQRGHVYRHIRQCHRGQNVYVIDLN
ncbi:zinc finger protein CKR1-like [Pseudomyrmex gracilis]|uniref:zinc finger protein CKR1-like n=1 Tax=Pseudomyrmex gracilis TaxID=219809 RepID=UPI000994B925|nr:zinc finger protein CKR1-like [Pseudomyrmex gracilis]